MTDAQFILAVLIVAPLAILVSVAMLRGYHLLVHLYRPDRDEECEHDG